MRPRWSSVIDRSISHGVTTETQSLSITECLECYWMSRQPDATHLNSWKFFQSYHYRRQCLKEFNSKLGDLWLIFRTIILRRNVGLQQLIQASLREPFVWDALSRCERWLYLVSFLICVACGAKVHELNEPASSHHYKRASLCEGYVPDDAYSQLRWGRLHREDQFGVEA